MFDCIKGIGYGKKTMKIIRRILYFIAGMAALLCGVVLLCAVNPDMAGKIAAFLHVPGSEALTAADISVSLTDVNVQNRIDPDRTDLNQNDPELSGLNADGSGRPDAARASQSADGSTGSGSSADTDSSARDGAGTAADNNQDSEYIPASPSEIVIPEEVAGRNGYEPIRESGEEIGEEAADQLVGRLDIGAAGDGLTFDAAVYPYYAMLDATEQRLYRQIYANANELNRTFAPAAEVSAGQLRDIFAAVYNDHPELFWLDTAYSCKYRRNGPCVEIGLQFNRTAQDLDNARAQFQAGADRILAEAAQLGSAYEQEKAVHDVLLEQVTYDMGAEMHQSAYSALVNGQSVCAGYARAFQYLLQQLGIPCYYCTGYAGEDHAWNIVRLEDGFYNVDVTWDDAGQGRYGYFNKTDADYGNTHIREELSVYLPPCGGERYRNLETDTGPESGLRSAADLGIGEESILRSMTDYYNDCYRQITENGTGSYVFYNVIEGEQLLQEWSAAHETEGYRQGYMEGALTALNASACDMRLEVEKLQQDRYLVIHSVTVR